MSVDVYYVDVLMAHADVENSDGLVILENRESGDICLITKQTY